MKNKFVKFITFLIVFIPSIVLAQEIGAGPFSGLDIETILKPSGFTSTINLLIALSSIGLIPFFLISTTSFLRTVIVLSMIRQAIGTQSSPPSPIIIALAMFMTIFVMTPTWNEVNESAVKPYKSGKISQNEAIQLGAKPFRNFMLKFIRDKDLALFLEFSQMKSVNDYEKVPIFVLVPAFVISELKTAFQIGFLLFIPFVVIDLIVSNILLSLGMFMLSPAMISLPFKILLFVLTDGWNLIIRGLLISFQ
ncbi:flagellar type III secretion system pore protein FliP [bacterium]|jgi:flagellar biosynthesis protein FliP|nr:flagellar type III secretion system pore protein FliP [bacterium]